MLIVGIIASVIASLSIYWEIDFKEKVRLSALSMKEAQFSNLSPFDTLFFKSWCDVATFEEAV